jgi:hypothetical protein
MSIINRRNALFGWLAWKVAKRVGKRQAVKRLPVDDARTGLSAGFAAALAATAGALLFWRRRRGSDDAAADGAEDAS